MKMKKTFACLLAVLLLFGIMPTGVFADETSDGETTDEPRYKVAIQLTDSETDFTDSNPYYSLEGSVYDIYKDVADPDNYSYWEQEPYATTQATDANGYCEVPGGLPGGNYVAIMRTRATGYRYDRNHYVFGITDKDVLLTATVKPS
ncbi:MAG: SpaA isopeptide-forming pilin-related protein, partial [Dialister invisus]|nr:SpaA isopeptide-forming pilin-related protein [Dialister invisus]